MIARLEGTVLGAAGSRLVIGVGGVGFAVAVTPQQSLLATVGSSIALHTALIVREDDLSLFGFSTAAELEAFDLLRGISGVGPKSALGVLSHLTPDDLADAVDREDERAFKSVSGIGPKTARLIIVQLAGKVHRSAPSTARSGHDDDVLVALTGLGWPERQAKAALESVGAHADAGSLLRAALAELGPRG